MLTKETAYERRWQALALLAVAQFVVIVDITIVNIALPSIQSALHFTASNLQWVMDAYLLTFGGFLLFGGRASDLIGRRRIFMFGLDVFGLATLWCGFAQTSGELIAGRALQGLGGAMLSPAALALLAVTFQEGKERNKAMGVWSAVGAAGGAMGVVLGGVLTNGPGWEWVFWVNVPFTLGGAIIAPRLLAESRSEAGGQHLDLAGAITVTAGLSALIYGLVQVAVPGVAWPMFAIPLAAAVILLAAFVVIETRSAHPLVPFRFFRMRMPTTANFVMLAFAAGVVAMNYFVSLYLQQILHYDALLAGLAFVPMAVTTVGSSQLAARLLGRLGLGPVLAIGLVGGALGLLWLATIPVNGNYFVNVLGPAVVLGLAAGFAFVAVMTAAVSGVSAEDTGLSGGLINMSQQIGGALGLAVLSTLAVWRTNVVAGSARPDLSAMTEGYRLGFLVGAAITLLAAIVACPLLWQSGRPAAVQPAAESQQDVVATS